MNPKSNSSTIFLSDKQTSAEYVISKVLNNKKI